MNATHHHYRVGGHLFSLALPPKLVPAAALAPYAPFRTKEPEADAAPLFSLTLAAHDHHVCCTSPAARHKARLWLALLPVRRYLLAICRRTALWHST